MNHLASMLKINGEMYVRVKEQSEIMRILEVRTIYRLDGPDCISLILNLPVDLRFAPGDNIQIAKADPWPKAKP